MKKRHQTNHEPSIPHMHLPHNFYHSRKLEQLVENRTSYSTEHAELNIYETHHYAEKVFLQFSQPVLASMLEGKKVMHLKDREAFNFLPGESLCLPSGEVMHIDFPEAQDDSPTRCLAMQMNEDLIKSIVAEMNEEMPKADDHVWQLSDTNYSFTNDNAIHQLLQRLIYVFMEGHSSKELFISLMMKELVIRIKQAENRDSYHNSLLSISDSNRMAYVIKYIRDHIDHPLSIKVLAEKAHMSEPNFHKVFKDETGMSPIHFINQTRIKRACAMLTNPGIKMKEVFLACGFNNLSYFNRTFRKIKQMSPRQYQNQLGKMAAP